MRLSLSHHYYPGMDPAPCPARPLPATQELARRIERVLTLPPAGPDASTGRLAAVLILLYERAGEPHLVLTKRSETLEHHPGQIALPGGRFDTDDGDLATTALRETFEEIGVDPAVVRLLGRLADVETRITEFTVAPYVGVTTEPLDPVPSESEIARVIEVALADLLDADDRLPPSPDIITLRYPLDGEDVWGATARILREFSGVVREALDGDI